MARRLWLDSEVLKTRRTSFREDDKIDKERMSRDSKNEAQDTMVSIRGTEALR